MNIKARSILEELDDELVDLDEEEDENEEEKEGKIKSAKDPDFAEGGEEIIKKKLRQIKPVSLENILGNLSPDVKNSCYRIFARFI